MTEPEALGPTLDVLMREHRFIERLLGALEVLALEASRGVLEGRQASDLLGLIREYADRCHHGKEEEHLFPLLERRGFHFDRGPTAVMRQEHTLGRAHVQALVHAVESEGLSAGERCQMFSDRAGRFVKLLREHIRKEDHCLFPMAVAVIRPEDEKALLAAYAEFERASLGGADGVRLIEQRIDALCTDLGS